MAWETAVGDVASRDDGMLGLTPQATMVNSAHMVEIDEATVRKMLREACDAAGGVRAWARDNGVSAPYVSDVLAGNKGPGPAILDPLNLDRTKVLTTIYKAKETT